MTGPDVPSRDRADGAVPAAEGGPAAEAAPEAERGPDRPRRAVLRLAGLAGAVVILPLALAVAITGVAANAGPGLSPVVSPDELEEELGIRVDLVAVIAAGGLVDVRFTVIDSEKAGHFLHDDGALPELYLERSGAVLRTSRPKAHKMTVVDGASYFVLYPNSGGLVQAGTEVSVVVGGLRLAPVRAQA